MVRLYATMRGLNQKMQENARKNQKIPFPQFSAILPVNWKWPSRKSAALRPPLLSRFPQRQLLAANGAAMRPPAEASTRTSHEIWDAPGEWG